MTIPRSRIEAPRSPPVASAFLFRKWTRKPPTRAGVLSSSGRYMPSAKMRAGTPSISIITAITAPAPKRM